MEEKPPANSVRAIFDQALEIDSVEERLAYLVHACGENPQLRQEVETLLATHPEMSLVR